MNGVTWKWVAGVLVIALVALAGNSYVAVIARTDQLTLENKGHEARLNAVEQGLVRIEERLRHVVWQLDNILQTK